MPLHSTYGLELPPEVSDDIIRARLENWSVDGVVDGDLGKKIHKQPATGLEIFESRERRARIHAGMAELATHDSVEADRLASTREKVMIRVSEYGVIDPRTSQRLNPFRRRQEDKATEMQSK